MTDLLKLYITISFPIYHPRARLVTAFPRKNSRCLSRLLAGYGLCGSEDKKIS